MRKQKKTYEELVEEHGKENVSPDLKVEPQTEIDRALDAYYDRFGECFPSNPLRWGRSDEKVIEMIRKCLAEDKDVIEMGFYEAPPFDVCY